MTEIFITDVHTKIEADRIVSIFKNSIPVLTIHFDLNDTEKAYPCGHTIIKVKGKNLNGEMIRGTFHTAGYRCEILENKVCI